MPILRIKGHDYNINPVKDSHMRRATQFENSILQSLSKIGISNDYVDVTQERVPIKKAKASASWYIEGFHCHFSFNKMTKFVDNLLVVQKVIEYNINELMKDRMTIEEFVSKFKEDHDFDEKRTKAREFFGVEHDHIDMQEINLKYKKLAKTLHPDMPTGDHEKFKELNEHHKTLKRELE